MVIVNAEDVNEDVNVEGIKKLMNSICILRYNVFAKTHVMLAALIKEIKMMFIIMFSTAPTSPMIVLSYCILTLHIYEVYLAQAS